MGSTGGGGGNLGKMAKNCMKMTKSSFWGQNSGGYGGNKLIFWVVGAIPPPPPTRGKPDIPCHISESAASCRRLHSHR